MADAVENSFLGKSAQLAVMSRLVMFGCHVAIPEPDYGTDIFVLREDREDTARVQVKSAKLTPYEDGNGFRAQFSVKKTQLDRPDQPPLYYVFVPREGERFPEVLVVPRRRLQALRNASEPIKLTPDGDNYKLTIQFRAADVLCGEAGLTEYREAWHLLPPVLPPTTTTLQPPATG